MKLKKTPPPERGGNAERVNEFARLVLELAVLNPERLHEFGEEMQESRAVPAVRNVRTK